MEPRTLTISKQLAMLGIAEDEQQDERIDGFMLALVWRLVPHFAIQLLNHEI